nr:TetR family transcriptional regulator C-terminal domain-containing protein [Streptomyces sp. CB02130]
MRRAQNPAALQAGVREEAGRMRGFIAQQLRQAGADGVDPERAATGLMALVDGLGMQMLSRQYPEEDAVAALDAHLGLIFDADHATRQ